MHKKKNNNWLLVKLLSAMFRDLLRIQYDSYRPEISHSLASSIKRYINAKPKYERRSSEFINDIRQKLYVLHEYNLQVAKFKCKYPRSKQFNLLLAQYIELEYECLYHYHEEPSKEAQSTVEERVLRTLQVMLYHIVYNDETLIDPKADAQLKKEVLKILAGVKIEYFVENKLVVNIAKRLLEKLNGGQGDITETVLDLYLKDSFIVRVQKTVTTSDYGTDTDSDFESDRLFSHNSRSQQNVALTNGCRSNTSKRKTRDFNDVQEVLPTRNGLTPIPTIELTDDDGYMVYLEKTGGKPKIVDTKTRQHKPSTPVEDVVFVNNKTDKPKLPTPIKSKVENDVVLICSDSEDEDSVTHGKTKTKKSDGVVTFEIMDDDDDSELNYMVYLHKEVETNARKDKKRSEVSCNEIIVCSDSEDDCGNTEKISDDNGQTSNGNGTALPATDSVSIFEDVVLNDLLHFVAASNDSNESSLLKEITTLKDGCLPSIFDRGGKLDASTLQRLDSENEIQLTNFEDSQRMNLINPMSILKKRKSDQTDDLESETHPSSDLGGPLIGDCDDGALEDYQLNDSALEELILDNSFLSERRGFEDLEYFLSNNNEGSLMELEEIMRLAEAESKKATLRDVLDCDFEDELTGIASKKRQLNCDPINDVKKKKLDMSDVSSRQILKCPIKSKSLVR